MVQMRYDNVKKLRVGENSDDLMRFIEKDGSNSSMTTDSDDGKLYSQTSCSILAHALNTNKFHVCSLCLVVLDCFVVIAVLMIELDVFQTGKVTYLPQILRYISLGFVTAFLLEVLLKVVVFRKDFLCNKLELFDMVVIGVTFALQVAFINEEGIKSGFGLIIGLRLWRVTKVLNAVIMSVKRHSDRMLAREQRTREALERELMKYREYCSAQESEIEALRQLLRQHHIDYQRPSKPTAGCTIDVVAEVNDFSDKLTHSLKPTETCENSEPSS